MIIENTFLTKLAINTTGILIANLIFYTCHKKKISERTTVVIFLLFMTISAFILYYLFPNC